MYLNSTALNGSAVDPGDANITVINVTKIPTVTTVEVLNTTVGNVTIDVVVTNSSYEVVFDHA